MSIGEIMENALVNTLLGMGTVFLMLIFISLIISLLKYIPSGKQAAQPAAEAAAEDAGPCSGLQAEDSDEQLIAVITAAIMAAKQAEAGSKDEAARNEAYIVRSIRKRG